MSDILAVLGLLVAYVGLMAYALTWNTEWMEDHPVHHMWDVM